MPGTCSRITKNYVEGYGKAKFLLGNRLMLHEGSLW